MEEVVDDDVVQAVGSPFETSGQYRVGLQERVEGNGQCVDVDRSAQVHRATEVGLTLREHLLAGCQLANDRCRKQSPHTRLSITQHHRHDAHGDDAAGPKRVAIMGHRIGPPSDNPRIASMA